MVWRGADCTQSLGILQNKEPLRYHVPKSEQGTCRRSEVTEVHRPGISVPISEPSHRASWAEYWHKWRRGPSLPFWWQPWIAIFYFFVWEHVWAVQLDLCASTCSVPGLPRAIPNISLAETAVPTDKIHFFHIQRTRRHPQTLNQAMHFYYPTCISQEYWSRCFLFIFKQKDVKLFPFILKR